MQKEGQAESGIYSLSAKRGRQQGSWATPRPQLTFLTITSNLRKGTFPKHRFQRKQHKPRSMSSFPHSLSASGPCLLLSLSAQHMLHSVLEIDKLSHGASAGPTNPAPSILSHTSDCQDHFFTYRLTCRFINKSIQNSKETNCK